MYAARMTALKTTYNSFFESLKELGL